MKFSLSLLALATHVVGNNTNTPDLILETKEGDPEKNNTSGSIIIRSGSSYNESSAGSIVISGGLSMKGEGSEVNVTAGNSNATGNGGTLFLSGGHGKVIHATTLLNPFSLIVSLIRRVHLHSNDGNGW